MAKQSQFTRLYHRICALNMSSMTFQLASQLLINDLGDKQQCVRPVQSGQFRFKNCISPLLVTPEWVRAGSSGVQQQILDSLTSQLKPAEARLFGSHAHATAGTFHPCHNREPGCHCSQHNMHAAPPALQCLSRPAWACVVSDASAMLSNTDL